MPARIHPDRLMPPGRTEVRVVMKHIHSFIRHKKTPTGIQMWRCADPDCMYVIDQASIRHKRTLCSHCKEFTFVLQDEDLRRAKPRCPQKCSEVLEHQVARQYTSKTGSIIEGLFPTADMQNPIGDD